MRKAIATLGATMFAVAAMAAVNVAPALAYAAQGTSAAGVLGSTFTATFKDPNGGAVSGASVTFSQQSGPANCQATFSPATGTTDANGSASTTISLPCNGCYVLGATTGTVTVTATTCKNAFPATSAEAPNSQGPPVWVWAALAGGIALIAIGTGAVAVRRR